MIPNHVKREIARNKYNMLLKDLGSDHPETKAAYGRFIWHVGGYQPADGIALVAYYREGQVPGCMNRSFRRNNPDYRVVE